MKTKLGTTLVALIVLLGSAAAQAGEMVLNGWYKGKEVFYTDAGPQKNVEGQPTNDIYIIGDIRKYQAHIVETVLEDADYSPLWDVHIVHTKPGVTVQKIIDAGLASPHFPTDGVVFDNIEDIKKAEKMGLVSVEKPGVIVLCPVLTPAQVNDPANTPVPKNFKRLTRSSIF